MILKEILIKLGLLYRPLVVKDVYKKNPPGVLNVTRLINQQAPWLNPGTTNSTWQKKKLIINIRVFYDLFSYTNKQDLKDALKLLLKANFEIYYPTDKQLKKIKTKKLLHKTLDKLKYIEPTQLALLLQACNFTKDSILVIDDFYVIKLLNELHDSSLLTLSDYKNLYPDISKLLKLAESDHNQFKYILDLAKGQAINYLSLTQYSGLEKENLITDSFFSAGQIDLSIHPDSSLSYKKIILHYPDTVYKIRKLTCELDCNDNDTNSILLKYLSEQNWVGLETVRLCKQGTGHDSNAMIPEQLALTLISRCIKLKTITIEGLDLVPFEKSTHFFSSDFSHLKNLENLELCKSKIPWHFFFNLVNASFLLKTLKINNIYLYESNTDLIAPAINSYQNLHTLIVTLNQKNSILFKKILIENIINKANNLQKLNLHYPASSVAEACSLQPSTNIKELTISSQLIPEIHRNIIEKLQLKTLILKSDSRCFEIPEQIFWLDFSKMTTLNLKNSKVSFSQLIHILKNSTSIEKLIIDDCNNLVDKVQDFPDIKLAKIKHFKPKFATFSFDNLVILISFLTHVKSIDLDMTSVTTQKTDLNLRENALLKTLKLPELDYLHFDIRSLTKSHISLFISLFQKIKTLVIDGGEPHDWCEHNPERGLTFDKVKSLPGTEKLIIDSMYISGDIIDLTDFFPNLHSLSLVYCVFKKHLDNNGINKALPFNKLKILRTFLSSTDLKYLTNNAQHLKKLKLSASQTNSFDTVDSGSEEIRLTGNHHLSRLDKVKITFHSLPLEDIIDLSLNKSFTQFDLTDSNIIYDGRRNYGEFNLQLSHIQIVTFKNLSDDDQLISFTKCCSHIKKAIICKSILSTKLLLFLISNFPELNVLKIENCSIENFPRLKKTDLLLNNLFLKNITFDRTKTLYDFLNDFKKLNHMIIHDSNISISSKVAQAFLKQKLDLNRFEAIQFDDISIKLQDELNKLNNRLDSKTKLKFKNNNNHPAKNLFSDKENFDIDINTSYSSKTFKVQQYFLPKKSSNTQLEPNHYRLHVIKNTNSSGKYLIAMDMTPNLLQMYKLKHENSDDNIFLGYIPSIPLVKKSLVLPSLTAADELIAIESTLPITIEHHPDSGLYYVNFVLTENKNTPEIFFLVKANFSAYRYNSDCLDIANAPDFAWSKLRFFSPTNYYSSDLTKFLLPHNDNALNTLLSIAKFTSRFKKRKKKTTTSSSVNSNSTSEKINFLIEHQEGACRHRAMVFYWIANALNFRVRYISNDCHAFIEVYFAEQWITFDLGGYPATLKQFPVALDIDDASDSDNDIDSEVQDNMLIDPNSSVNTLEDKIAVEPIVATSKITLAADNPFYTWHDYQLNFKTFNEITAYLDKLKTVSYKPKQILWLVDSTTSIFNLHLYFANYYKNNHVMHDYLYIPDLGEIHKQDLLINTNCYQTLTTIDSPLVTFFKTAHANSILFINLEQGNPARQNTLLDNERKLDGIPLSQDVLIIAAMTKQQINQQSEDFFSRFSTIKDIHIDFQSSSKLVELDKLPEQFDSNNSLTVEFHDESAWEEILLGRVTIAGQKVLLTPGLLINAARQNINTLIFSHAPWENAEFSLFYQTLLQQKHFFCYGQTYHLPEALVIYRHDSEYSFCGSYSLITLADNQQVSLYSVDSILNNALFHSFFTTYRCEGSDLIQQPGYLAQYKDQTITLFVTDNLTPGKWAKFIHEANIQRCFLNLIVAEGVDLPDKMLEQAMKQKFFMTEQPFQNQSVRNKLIIIQTTDSDYSVEATAYIADQVIHVTTQTTFADLFGILEILPTDNFDNLKFRFKTSAIWQALTVGKTVLLTGHLSNALAQELEILAVTGYVWINGKKCMPQGRLLLITDDSNPFKVIPVSHYDSPDQQNYWSLISAKCNIAEPLLKRLQYVCQTFQTSVDNWQWHYVQLKTMALSLLRAPESNPLMPFLRPDNNSQHIHLAKTLWQQTITNVLDLNVIHKNSACLRPLTDSVSTDSNAVSSQSSQTSEASKVEQSINDSHMDISNSHSHSHSDIDISDRGKDSEAFHDDMEVDYEHIDSLADNQNYPATETWDDLYEQPIHLQASSSPQLAKASSSSIPLAQPSVLVEDAQAVINKRLEKIAKLLAQQPFLFLVGPSGTGKTTFIKKELGIFFKKTHKKEITVYMGEEQKTNWLQDQEPNNLKIYLADEINLESPDKSDLFEVFYTRNKTLLLDGKLYPLSDNHKVIFTGNYNTFTDRIEHRFFKRHGGTIRFNSLPDNFLAEKIITPALHPLTETQSMIKKHIPLMITLFIQSFHAVNNELETMCKHPLTPRNLGMMSLRFYLLYQKNHHFTPPGSMIADHQQIDNLQPSNELPVTVATLLAIAIYDEIVSILNPDKALEIIQSRINSIDVSSAINSNLQTNNPVSTHAIESKLVLTSNRKEMLRSLTTHLGLRQLRLDNASNPGFSGLGIKGLLFEGPSGIGKTHVIIHYLKSLGFQNGNDSKTTFNPHAGHTKLFYHLTPSDVSLLKNTLEKAHQQGAVVVIDEINTLPLEHILNDLLSGESSEPASHMKAGFCMIATQNPITFSGRKLLSDAFLRRFDLRILHDFTQPDLVELAKAIGNMDETEATALAENYLQAKQVAEDEGIINPPNSRTFLQFLQNRKQPVAAAKKTDTCTTDVSRKRKTAQEDEASTAKKTKIEMLTTSTSATEQSSSNAASTALRPGL